jgi:hypothetical protein
MMIRRLIVTSILVLLTISEAGAQTTQELIYRRDRRQLLQEEYLKTYQDSTGAFRPDLWQRGVDHFQQMEPDYYLGGTWTQVGPAPLRIDKEQIFQGAGPDSGEVVDIAIDPRGTTDQVIYIATNDGGIWKTTNGGTSWQPKTDFMPSLSMGAVTLDPRHPDVVYAGTGNLFDGGGQFFKGLGIYKSNDGGNTWSILNPGNIFTGRGINRLLHPPTPPGFTIDLLLAATNVGLFRSINGGVRFGTNPPNFDNGLPVISGFISDLRSDTSSPYTIYAAVRGSGIFRSNDSGVTFPDNLFNNPGAPAPGSFLSLTFSQSALPDNQRIYASVQNVGMPPFKGLYRSDNAGASWILTAGGAGPGADNGGCQCSYDLTVGVDPQNLERVYLGFQELYLSMDGGNTFGIPAISRNKTHWDHHALVFSPRSHRGAPPTRIWTGTDGGIHSSMDGGNSWTNLNETIATNLFTHIDIGRNSAQNNMSTFGGTQDTGTIEHRPPFPGADWHLAIDGDGGGVAVDPSNPLIAYGAGNNGFTRTADGGANWAKPVGRPPSAWRHAIDQNTTSNVFTVTSTNSGFSPGTQLYRSTDTGLNFSLIKTFSAAVQSIANTKADSNRIWVGLTDGTLQRSNNALAASPTWSAILVPGNLSQAVTGIAINPLNEEEVIITYRGFCGGGCPVGTRTKHVFRTADNGATWTDISGTDGSPATNLPDLPTHSVVIDPGAIPTIVVSNDAGVLVSTDRGATWTVFGVGLPTVDSKQLAIDPSATPSVLRIGTYGRSVFELK